MAVGMGLVRACLRADLRRRWREWLALAVLVGALGGVVLAVLAGARRTEVAYERFLEASAGDYSTEHGP